MVEVAEVVRRKADKPDSVAHVGHADILDPANMTEKFPEPSSRKSRWSAELLELFERYLELSENLEEQRRTNFTSAMQRDGYRPAVRVRPAFMAIRLTTS